jgi:glutamine cyclotransferase
MPSPVDGPISLNAGPKSHVENHAARSNRLYFTQRMSMLPEAAHMQVVPHILRFLASVLVVAILTSCDQKTSSPSEGTVPAVQSPSNGSGSANPNVTTTNAPPVYGYEVINAWPHNRNAFTQGLLFLDGALFESTGLNGESSLRKVDLETGNVLKRVEVPQQYFAEGLAALNGKLYQLTWQNRKGFVYDLNTFQLEKEFTYQGEGWGLTTDGQWLIMSDGTDQIRFLDPNTFEEKRRISVVANGQPVARLNELEYIKGEIFANVWGTWFVARIDPATGKVLSVIDFTGLLSTQDRDETTDVLNGIAYDPKGDRLFVTGKRWPKLYEVRLKLKQSPQTRGGPG